MSDLREDIEARAEELGEQAGGREASRLIQAIVEGRSDASIESALGAGDKKRIEVRDRVLQVFSKTGRFPSDVRVEIPSVESQIGTIIVTSCPAPDSDYWSKPLSEQLVDALRDRCCSPGMPVYQNDQRVD